MNVKSARNLRMMVALMVVATGFAAAVLSQPDRTVRADDPEWTWVTAQPWGTTPTPTLPSNFDD